MVSGSKKQAVSISYPSHTGGSVFQQFTKKISPAVIKWNSILKLTADGEPLIYIHALSLVIHAH